MGMAEVGHGEVNVFWVSVGESGVAGFGCDAGFFFFFFFNMGFLFRSEIRETPLYMSPELVNRIAGRLCVFVALFKV